MDGVTSRFGSKLSVEVLLSTLQPSKAGWSKRQKWSAQAFEIGRVRDHHQKSQLSRIVSMSFPSWPNIVRRDLPLLARPVLRPPHLPQLEVEAVQAVDDASVRQRHRSPVPVVRQRQRRDQVALDSASLQQVQTAVVQGAAPQLPMQQRAASLAFTSPLVPVLRLRPQRMPLLRDPQALPQPGAMRLVSNRHPTQDRDNRAKVPRCVEVGSQIQIIL